MPALPALEVVDATEGVIIIQHDRDLSAFLHGGDDLGVQHQVAAITKKRINFACRIRELDAECAGYFVAHARVAVFGMIVGSGLAAPEFVNVAGNSTRSMNHRAIFIRKLIQHPNDLTLIEQPIGT